ncbi:class I SAM-dependent methyltransferase [Stappia sp.]|uniref:class I SAM-dependent methyltransferase n=1 Tax=Stappia sp. TaxID=1870903 RepID=UPI003A99336E
MTGDVAGEKFEHVRHRWVEAALAARPQGSSLLDVGAGECRYKQSATHLAYTSQDVAEYDGSGDGSGLQTGSFDFSRIDIVCDILDIPEDRKFDAVLCTEVLEHVPDPAASLRKIARLVAPGGELIVTAPFCSLTHFAPHFHATGLSVHFYRKHLGDEGLEIVEMTPNGGYFDWVAHEVGRVQRVYRQYGGGRLGPFTRVLLWLARARLRALARAERAEGAPASAELLTNGYFVRARRPAKA